MEIQSNYIKIHTITRVITISRVLTTLDGICVLIQILFVVLTGKGDCYMCIMDVAGEDDETV